MGATKDRAAPSRRASERTGCRCTHARVPAKIVIRVGCDLDIATAPCLLRSVSDALRVRMPIALDLSRVSFVDASGLGAIVASQRLAHDLATPFALRTPSSCVRRLLEVARMDGVFVVEPLLCCRETDRTSALVRIESGQRERPGRRDDGSST